MSRKNNTGGLVYSTEHGRMCPGCGQPEGKCQCSGLNIIPKGDGIVRVGRETKGRKGKGVTVITGLPLGGDDLKKLSTKLKNKCGCGGTVKDHVIEIQGDKRDQLVDELSKMGYKVKKSGG
ncbi:MAG: translation initiation factor Sui1 [Sedimentisphaeraceae bacterium JB056]